MINPKCALKTTHFMVKKNNLNQCEFTSKTLSKLKKNEVMLQLEKFALSTNNITYAACGESLSYWNFFPAPKGWGRIPVWGYATVIETKHKEIAIGERFYGYYPISSHLILRPGDVTSTTFIDTTRNRSKLNHVYNIYCRTSNKENFENQKDAYILFLPLFITAYLCALTLIDEYLTKINTVIISSASSKTAMCLAFLLGELRPDVNVIALTSLHHKRFVSQLGYYKKVITYDEINHLINIPSVFVDMTNDAAIMKTVQLHLNNNLMRTIILGATHGNQKIIDRSLYRNAIFFYAPDHINKISDNNSDYSNLFYKFISSANTWLAIITGSGEAEIEKVYFDLLNGRSTPDVGYILSL